MTSEIEIERMGDDDVSAVAAVVSAAYRFLADKQGFTDLQLERLLRERCSEEWIRAHYKVCQSFVARQNGAVAAVLVVKGNEIEELFVDAESHGQGIGTALFRVAEELIIDSGHSEIRVWTTGYAIPFYEAMGAHVDGNEECSSGPLVGWSLTLLKKSVAR